MTKDFPANIPTSWLQDIATIGTSSHKYYRDYFWDNWTLKQRMDALNYYSDAINQLSKTIDVVDDLNRRLGNSYSCVIYSFQSSTGIDCSKHYTCKELTNAILKWQQKEEEYYNNVIKENYELFS